MINFPHAIFKRKADGSSYIPDKEIETYAERVLEDYSKQFNKDLLITPQPMPWSHFLEFYLGRDVRYENIPSPSFGEEILGACSFAEQTPLEIYNNEKQCREHIALHTGDIVLNSFLEEQPQRLLFTALHEGGHWLLHKPYYDVQNDRSQLSFLGDERQVIKCCRTSDIEAKGSLETTEDHIEHQANTLAAALAVPAKTLIPFVAKMFKKHGFNPNDKNDEMFLDELITRSDIINEVATTFGVSKQVIEIRMDKYGLWDKKPKTLFGNDLIEQT